jgi:hypothetical protein
MIAFVSWHATKVEIVRYMLLKSGTSTLIILHTFTHFKPMVPCPCRTCIVQGHGTKDTKVERPLSEQLSAWGRLDPINWCPIKYWTPPIGAFGALENFKNISELAKLWPLKLKGSRTQKKQTTEHKKFGSQTPKKYLVCCSSVIRV